MAGSGAKESFPHIRSFLRNSSLDETVVKEAKKEFEDLLKHEAQQISLPSLTRIDPDKEWKEEQKKEFPHLFRLLLEVHRVRETNANYALLEMKTLIDKKTAAMMQLKNLKQIHAAIKEPEVKLETAAAELDNKSQETAKETKPTEENQDGKDTETQNLEPSANVDDANPPKSEEQSKEMEIETSEAPVSAILELLSHDKVKEIGELREKAFIEYENLVKKGDVPSMDSTDASKREEKEEKLPTIEYILQQHKPVDDDRNDDLRHALEDYRRLQTSEHYLKLDYYRDMNFLKYTECSVKSREGILTIVPEATGHGLLRFLEATDKSLFIDQYTEESMWNEFARLQIAELIIILERKARGPDLNKNVVIEREVFDKMQDELVKKTEEVEELSTRLSRFASNQLTEGNPNIADLSDAHRPTKVGEMFGQLYDDEWSEAFEALKPPQEGEEEEDEVCVDVLMTLQKIVMKAFEYCSKEVESQMKKLEKDIAGAVEIKLQEKKDETEAKEPSSESTKDDNKEGQPENVEQAKDQSPMQEGGGDGKGEKQAEEGMKGQVNQRLKHYVEKQAKEMIKGLASFSSKNAADVFVSEHLPTIIQGEKCNEKRVIAYSKKCIELCWYMSVQDPPMILVALADGDNMNTEQYCYHYRKGKVVELCLWPALFLHTGGPLVAKGHALPKEKGK